MQSLIAIGTYHLRIRGFPRQGNMEYPLFLNLEPLRRSQQRSMQVLDDGLAVVVLREEFRVSQQSRCSQGAASNVSLAPASRWTLKERSAALNQCLR